MTDRFTVGMKHPSSLTTPPAISTDITWLWEPQPPCPGHDKVTLRPIPLSNSPGTTPRDSHATLTGEPADVTLIVGTAGRVNGFSVQFRTISSTELPASPVFIEDLSRTGVDPLHVGMAGVLAPEAPFDGLGRTGWGGTELAIGVAPDWFAMSATVGVFSAHPAAATTAARHTNIVTGRRTVIPSSYREPMAADTSHTAIPSPADDLVTVGRVRDILDEWYPPSLAESWDAPGLVCGDPDDTVNHIVCALEATDDVVDAAIAAHADMLVVHHPLLMRGVSSVAADTAKGRIIHQLIRHRIALMSAHTNADAAVGGVNDVLARLLGVVVERPLEPVTQAVDLWGVQVPLGSSEALRNALFDAGAGRFDGYDKCSFETVGRGQFRPLDGSHPTIGTAHEVETVEEARIHVVAPTWARSAVRSALVAAHPYEVPAYDVTTIDSGARPGPTTPGIGRVGHLDEPMTLRSFTRRVSERLPRTVWGVRAAGDPDQPVNTVALCSGAGDSLLDAAAASNADVYLTSDLRHHPADEHLRAGGPALVDTAHWASESPWCADVAHRLHEELGLPCRDLGIRTDPWTLGAAVAQ